MRCYRRFRLEPSTARLFSLSYSLSPVIYSRPSKPGPDCRLVSRLLGRPRRYVAAAGLSAPDRARRCGEPYARELSTPPRQGCRQRDVQRCSPALVRHKQYPGQTGILAAALPPIPWPSLTWAPPIASPTRVASALLPVAAALRRRGFASPPSDGSSSRVLGCAFAARRASYLFCWILIRA
jgi:hypothetical protein